MNLVTNLDIYSDELEKSIADKMFWINIVDRKKIKGVLDYHCADGELINKIKKVLPSTCHCVGYEADEKCLKECKKKGVEAYDNFEECLKRINTKESVLILSDVLHEIYSLNEVEKIKEFWKKIFEVNFKYIVILDMSYTLPEAFCSVAYDLNKVFKIADEKQLNDFQNVWGSITNYRNFVHYLLKYRYVKNWNKELKKDYFSFNYSKMLPYYNKYNNCYRIMTYKEYRSPIVEKNVREKFNIGLMCNTHVKIILEHK